MNPLPQGVVAQGPITAPATDRYVASNPQAVEALPSPGQVYFTFMVDCAVHEGYVSPEGAEKILQALYPEVRS